MLQVQRAMALEEASASPQHPVSMGLRSICRPNLLRSRASSSNKPSTGTRPSFKENRRPLREPNRDHNRHPVPHWANSKKLSLNDKKLEIEPDEKGYIRINRTWQSGTSSPTEWGTPIQVHPHTVTIDPTARGRSDRLRPTFVWPCVYAHGLFDGDGVGVDLDRVPTRGDEVAGLQVRLIRM